ncbi:hypothetical protein ABXT57_03720 [Methylophilaceae bacterium Uisw_097]
MTLSDKLKLSDRELGLLEDVFLCYTDRLKGDREVLQRYMTVEASLKLIHEIHTLKHKITDYEET